MPPSFSEVTSLSSISPNVFGAHFDPSWFKGPGTCGGLVFATLARAFQSTETASDRKLRSIYVQLCAPAPATALTIEVEKVRTGKRISHLRALMKSADETIAIASAVLGTDRPASYDSTEFTMPEVPPPEDCPQLPPLPGDITYMQRLDARPCAGGIPMSGHPKPFSAGWVKPLESPEHFDEALAAGLLDMWWPAILVTQPKAHPMGSITFNANFYLPEKPLAVDYTLLTTQSSITRQGYSQERDMLWSRDGQLIAMAEQQILVIK